MSEQEKRKIWGGIFYPLIFVGLLWMVRLMQGFVELDYIRLGIYPRTYQGLLGIFFSPLIHASSDHLISNTIPLIILGSLVFYFYRPIAFSVFFWVYVMTGIWVWAAARDAYHIGASGLIYGFVSFLFLSGIIRRNIRLLAMSLFVVFIYGGLVWGVLPIRQGVSWESHLLGSLAGIVTAIHFRKEGPQRKKYSWENEEEPEGVDDTGNEPFIDNGAEDYNTISTAYIIKKSEDKIVPPQRPYF